MNVPTSRERLLIIRDMAACRPCLFGRAIVKEVGCVLLYLTLVRSRVVWTIVVVVVRLSIGLR